MKNDCHHRLQSLAVFSIRSCSISALFLFVTLLLYATSVAAGQKAAYLPLRIIASTTDTSFTAAVDDSLRSVLARSNQDMVSRENAEQLVDDKGWPPSRKALQGIAEKTGFDNVAIGTLTVIGNQISLDYQVFDLLDPDHPVYFSQETESLADLETIIADVISQIQIYVNREQYIASIVPEGNKRIDSGSILRKIRTSVGGAYDPAILREDLKAIYRMGFFDDVQIDVQDSDQGKQVIFRVLEKPVISSLSYTGQEELGESDIAEVVTIKENSILNPERVNAAAEAIKSFYKSKGYFNTEVTPNISYPTPETAAVRFVINEGKKIYIKEISFEGNKTFDNDDLEGVIETSERGWLSWLTDSGVLDKDVLNQDGGRITAFYHNNGFLEARVGEARIEQKEEWLYITFPIQEGNRFKVGTVTIEGDLIADKQILLDLLSLREEEYWSRKTLREDILKIIDYYSEKGYAFADIRPKMDKSETGTRVDLALTIDKGDLVHINRISIRGNTRTRDNVIRRDLNIAEGGVFDSRGIRISSQKLQRLGFFEEVNITPEPALDPAKMDVVIEVKEKSTGQFSVGAGYSSVDHLVVMGELSENNFLGSGHRLALSGNVGGSSSRYNLSWTNPRVYDTQLSMGVDLFNWERENNDYTKESRGGALRFGHPLWEKWRLYESYSYTETTLSEVDDDASYIIRESQDISVTSAIKMTASRDTRDRLYGATRGSKNQISVKYAGSFLGGDAEFTKLKATSSWYFSLPFSTVFHFLASAGQVWENEEDSLPVYERFYLGGINSIRGFEYGKVSPIDPDSNDRIGGERMWYTNTEFVFPLVKEQGFYGILFFDAGNSIADDYDGDRDIATAVGFELRWFSPMGPMRIVWGVNLDPLTDEDETVWDFSIGGTF
ncbi:MAG: outer membrane protein assembly factor BamA [Desulfobacterales bacterium]|nr:MAG: outer membrane protein assembly factor BamA [Desulfobacterales bacterium]